MGCIKVSLTFGRCDSLVVLAAPHWRVNVRGGAVTPVVVMVAPSVKVDEESSIMADTLDRGHTDEVGGFTILSFNAHTGSKQQTTLTSKLPLAISKNNSI